MLTALLAVVLSGCDEPAGDAATSEKPVGGVVGPATTKEAGCRAPGPEIGHWLPSFSGSVRNEATIRTVTTNPCPPFVELLNQIDMLVPQGERKAGTVAKEFASGVRGLASKYLAGADTARCLYEADKLTIGIYRHRDHPWSVGVVVALKMDAAADVALCYLIGQARSDPALTPIQPAEGPEPHFCVQPSLPERKGVKTAVVAFGSSTWMCDALARAVPSD
ncbi:hypothetical protein GCM10011609_10360 [Lentzea pudingi]|uniref:PknH-like extracellular domain-containing protein n=1 Tax=Lentzea pudingi TaxID=1789439 RepID=A0ABQ2HEM5_9PSEU|nr:hypothetical protein [Lentzea pudingi]GGM76350.1 hypothetical protein GCM10011609_10360 [Lentzea pudingi]